MRPVANLCFDRAACPRAPAVSTTNSHHVGPRPPSPPSHPRLPPRRCSYAASRARHSSVPAREARHRKPRATPPRPSHSPSGYADGPHQHDPPGAAHRPSLSPGHECERWKREQRRPQQEWQLRSSRWPCQHSHQCRVPVQRPILCQPIWARRRDGRAKPRHPRPSIRRRVDIFQRQRRRC